MEFKILHVVSATLSALTLWLANKKVEEFYYSQNHKPNLEYARLYNYLQKKPEHSESFNTICEELHWPRTKLDGVLKHLPMRIKKKGNLVYLAGFL